MTSSSFSRFSSVVHSLYERSAIQRCTEFCLAFDLICSKIPQSLDESLCAIFMFFCSRHVKIECEIVEECQHRIQLIGYMMHLSSCSYRIGQEDLKGALDPAKVGFSQSHGWQSMPNFWDDVGQTPPIAKQPLLVSRSKHSGNEKFNPKCYS